MQEACTHPGEALPPLRPSPSPQVMLYPAEVTETAPLMVQAEGMDPVACQLALALPYRPCCGDMLLVIGQADQAWAVGVLRGTGEWDLAVQGNISLHAMGGRLRLQADRGMRFEAPVMDLEAGRLSLHATRLMHTCGEWMVRVRGFLSCQAERMHQSIRDSSILHTGKAMILARKSVEVNGRRINLG